MKTDEDAASDNIHPDTKIIFCYAFTDCYRIRTITLPEGLVAIETGAFTDCTKITSLTIPQSVEIIGMKLKGITFYQYKRAFVEDTEFVPTFLATVKYTLTTFPLTIILSLIIAILLNKEIMRQLLNQGVDRAVLNIADGRIIPYNVLSSFGSTIVDVVQGLFGTLVTVLWRSGVQILLFLAGLQSISPALYEAARIDGATEWELFWKVTVPMISPMMLLTLVYTIVDSFTSIDNKLLAYIKTYGFANSRMRRHSAGYTSHSSEYWLRSYSA